jgi:hypothetical protein
MPNGDDEWARRYPLPHEQMVPVALLEEARAWARYYRTQVKHEGHPRGYICEKCRTFDALPWASDSACPDSVDTGVR